MNSNVMVSPTHTLRGKPALGGWKVMVKGVAPTGRSNGHVSASRRQVDGNHLGG
jgi:hypothetical protein